MTDDKTLKMSLDVLTKRYSANGDPEQELQILVEKDGQNLVLFNSGQVYMDFSVTPKDGGGYDISTTATTNVPQIFYSDEEGLVTSNGGDLLFNILTPYADKVMITIPYGAKKNEIEEALREQFAAEGIKNEDLYKYAEIRPKIFDQQNYSNIETILKMNMISSLSKLDKYNNDPFEYQVAQYFPKYDRTIADLAKAQKKGKEDKVEKLTEQLDEYRQKTFERLSSPETLGNVELKKALRNFDSYADMAETGARFHNRESIWGDYFKPGIFTPATKKEKLEAEAKVEKTNVGITPELTVVKTDSALLYDRLKASEAKTDREMALRTQALLKIAGHDDVGNMDGVIGDKTKTALGKAAIEGATGANVKTTYDAVLESLNPNSPKFNKAFYDRVIGGIEKTHKKYEKYEDASGRFKDLDNINVDQDTLAEQIILSGMAYKGTLFEDRSNGVGATDVRRDGDHGPQTKEAYRAFKKDLNLSLGLDADGNVLNGGDNSSLKLGSGDLQNDDGTDGVDKNKTDDGNNNQSKDKNNASGDDPGKNKKSFSENDGSLSNAFKSQSGVTAYGGSLIEWIIQDEKNLEGADVTVGFYFSDPKKGPSVSSKPDPRKAFDKPLVFKNGDFSLNEDQRMSVTMMGQHVLDRLARNGITQDMLVAKFPELKEIASLDGVTDPHTKDHFISAQELGAYVMATQMDPEWKKNGTAKNFSVEAFGIADTSYDDNAERRKITLNIAEEIYNDTQWANIDTESKKFTIGAPGSISSVFNDVTNRKFAHMGIETAGDIRKLFKKTGAYVEIDNAGKTPGDFRIEKDDILFLKDGRTVKVDAVNDSGMVFIKEAGKDGFEQVKPEHLKAVGDTSKLTEVATAQADEKNKMLKDQPGGFTLKD